MTIVSNNIKYLRRLNGLTQEQFSKRIGIKRSLLGAYEEARANPNLDNLQNIAKIFGTTVDAIIKTDIRKIRETPGLNYQTNQNIGSAKQADTNDNSSFATPIATVIDKYFTDVPVQEVRNMTPPTEPNIQSQRINNEPENNLNNSRSDINKNINAESFSNEMSQITGIPFINKSEIGNYISKRTINPYLSSLPKISIPKISAQNARAFVANDDFPNDGDIIIGELLERNAAINEGQHHILICTDGRVLFRRVFDLTRIKGCYLLSSDNHEISSTEISDSQIVEILKFSAHISYGLPKSGKPNPKIKNLIDELYRESGRS
jgi:transcriptional regulator with XRE-family HTH domain